MRILLLSAYNADSHQYWLAGLKQQFSEHQWTCLTLPARYFSWRVRGNALSWAFGPEAAQLKQPFDLIIATSMTDLATLRGFVPALSQVPTLLYFHENQFAYPTTAHSHPSVEPQITSLYSALAADHLAFNSEYNRTTFLHGVGQLLRKLPDQVPSGLVDVLKEKSCVLPVPLTSECFLPTKRQPGPLQVIWNHRWEYDKGPDNLLALAKAIAERKLPVKLHVVGQQFRTLPAAFKQMREMYGAVLGEWGYMQDKSAYRARLQRSDLVLSTALHDFQGIAVLEGVAAGALPVVPDRLAYTELFADEYRYAQTQETQQLISMIEQRVQQKQQGQLPDAPDLSHLSWETLRPSYEHVFTAIVAAHA